MTSASPAGARRVLVVGASSGVGRAVTLALGATGARVMAAARREDRLATLCSEGGGNVTVVGGDVRREESCQQMVAATIAALGGIDAIVYAAGVSNLAGVCDTSYDEWQRIFETNVVGAGRIFANACGELSTNRGQMLLLSSVSVQRPKPGLVPYAASKAALHKMVEGLRTEHPGDRVHHGDHRAHRGRRVRSRLRPPPGGSSHAGVAIRRFLGAGADVGGGRRRSGGGMFDGPGEDRGSGVSAQTPKPRPGGSTRSSW